MEKEDRMLLANIEDKIRQSEDRYMITFSSFLDLRQRSLAETVLKTRKDLNYGFYGGYENAERVICAFFPEGFLVGERNTILITNYISKTFFPLFPGKIRCRSSGL